VRRAGRTELSTPAPPPVLRPPLRQAARKTNPLQFTVKSMKSYYKKKT
jgi:hypothetical protein